MKKGTILFHPSFEFTDGETGRKYLIILNDPDLKKSEPFLLVKTTSQSHNKPETPGCHPDKNLYAINANQDFFPKKTWIQFFEIFEADSAKFIKGHFEKGLEIKGSLKPDTLRAIINCIRKSDDVFEYHFSLLQS